MHIFVERNDKNCTIQELGGYPNVVYHYDVLLEKLPKNLPACEKWPHIVYLRIFAPQFLKKYDRLVYLDADIYCLRATPEIWDIDLPCGVGAVRDQGIIMSTYVSGIPKNEWLQKIGLKSNRYFNSGVLIIDPKPWCQIDFTSALTGYFEQFGDTSTMWDQDFLNYHFHSKWTEFSPAFNYQASLFDSGFDQFFSPVLGLS